MSEHGPSTLRSARWFAARDLAGFIHRASLHSEGISRESLAGADRGAPREQLKTTLPVQVDGPLELGARAFAVGGRR